MKNEYAFPSAPESGLGSQGMTIRDVFAAAALPTAMQETCWTRLEGDTVSVGHSPQKAAAVAYAQADAMLAEREKGA